MIKCQAGHQQMTGLFVSAAGADFIIIQSLTALSDRQSASRRKVHRPCERSSVCLHRRRG